MYLKGRWSGGAAIAGLLKQTLKQGDRGTQQRAQLRQTLRFVSGNQFGSGYEGFNRSRKGAGYNTQASRTAV